MTFTLWLEFEMGPKEQWGIEDEYANILVSLADGRKYGINVCTYEALSRFIENDKKSGENLHGTYQIPPDLFVKEMTRACIEKTIADLLQKGDLDNLLNPSVLCEPDSEEDR